MEREQLIKEISDLGHKAAKQGASKAASVLFGLAGAMCCGAEDAVATAVMEVVTEIETAIKNNNIASKN